MDSIPLKIISDNKGYLDRECPNEECQFTFKINLEDWENKVSNGDVHCPLCGCVDSPENWWTKNQRDMMQDIVVSYAMERIKREIDKTFKSIERKNRNNKYIKIKYKPGRKVTFINNPIGQSEEWNLDITCQKCSTRYSVIGNAYFCPCCGYNSVEDVFEESLNTIQRMLHSIPALKKTLSNIHGDDSSEAMCRGLIEDLLENIVSAFQKFAASKFSNVSSKSTRVNDFQIIEKGSALFKEEIGIGYENWLTPTEIFKMSLYFQRRHLLEHNGGMVDEKYINKSGDTSYSINQRIIVKERDIQELLNIVKKLAVGLNDIK